MSTSGRLRMPALLLAAALLALGCGCQSQMHASRKTLKERGISVDAVTLAKAIDRRDAKLVEALLAAGLSPDAQEGGLGVLTMTQHLASTRKYSRVPLIRAINAEDPQIARLLIERGAKLDVHDSDGSSALGRAIVNGQTEIAMLIIAKSHKRWLDRRDREGDTALATAIIMRQEAIAKALLDKGAEFNTKNVRGETPLALAIRERLLALAEELIRRGSDVNCRSVLGEAPLSLAAEADDAWLIGLLLARGADPNAKTNRGDTALSAALKARKREAAELLLNHPGVDLTARDGYDADLAETAERNGFADLAAIICAKGHLPLPPGAAKKAAMPPQPFTSPRPPTRGIQRVATHSPPALSAPAAAKTEPPPAVLTPAAPAAARTEIPVKLKLAAPTREAPPEPKAMDVEPEQDMVESEDARRPVPAKPALDTHAEKPPPTILEKPKRNVHAETPQAVIPVKRKPAVPLSPTDVPTLPTTLAPGGPKTLAPGGPKTLAPGGPKTLAPGGPKTLAPGGPKTLEPGGPKTLAPGGPKTLAPGGPKTLAPGGPKTLAPGGPKTLAPGGPKTLAPGGPKTLAPTSKQPDNSKR